MAFAVRSSRRLFSTLVNNRRVTCLFTNRTLVGQTFGNKSCFSSHASGVVPSDTEGEKKHKVLYDGDCPLCMQEMKLVKYMNDKRNALDLVNIASPDYKPEDYSNISYERAMGVMHVIGPDDQVYTKVDAVHEMYSALGMRWIVAYMKWPLLDSLFDKSYMVFARNRLRWTTGWRGCEDDKCQSPRNSASK